MARYFTYKEFTRSATADRLGIDNTPTDEHIQDNIIETMRLMDKIRGKWSDYCLQHYLIKPQIIVTSGYRCNELNNAVGGSKTSQHRYGSACDFKANNGQNKALFEVIVEMIESGEITVGQLIWEQGNDDNPAWIHISLPMEHKKNDILRYEKGKGYYKYGG